MFNLQESTKFQNSLTPLAALRRRWWAVAVLYGLSLLGGAFWLPMDWRQQGFAAQWSAQAGIVLIYLLWQFQRNLTHNYRRRATTLLPTLGLGNSVGSKSAPRLR